MNDKDKEAFEKWVEVAYSPTSSLAAWQAACEYKQEEIDFLEAMNGRLEEARVTHLGTSEKYQAENKKLREVVENKEHETICWVIEKLRKLEKKDKSKWSHSRNLDFAAVELSDYLLIEWKRAKEALKEVDEE